MALGTGLKFLFVRFHGSRWVAVLAGYIKATPTLFRDFARASISTRQREYFIWQKFSFWSPLKMHGETFFHWLFAYNGPRINIHSLHHGEFKSEQNSPHRCRRIRLANRMVMGGGQYIKRVFEGPSFSKVVNWKGTKFSWFSVFLE